MVTVKEFRIAMPMKVEEYQRAQVAIKTQSQCGNGCQLLVAVYDHEKVKRRKRGGR